MLEYVYLVLPIFYLKTFLDFFNGEVEYFEDVFTLPFYVYRDDYFYILGDELLKDKLSHKYRMNLEDVEFLLMKIKWQDLLEWEHKITQVIPERSILFFTKGLVKNLFPKIYNEVNKDEGSKWFMLSFL